MDDEVHVVFRGTLAEMMLISDPALYWPFVSYETGNPVLYFRLQKSLYGCLKIALLFYKKIVGDLEAYGFKINPYDPCVSNKNIMRRRERGNKNDTLDRIRIWRNARAAWEET